MRPTRRVFAAAVLASAVMSLVPAATASAHDCEGERPSGFHSPGNDKPHCRAKK